MRGKWRVILHRHHCLEYHHSLSWHQASLFLGTPPMFSTAGWQLGSMGRGGCCGIHPGPPPMHRPKLPMLLVQQKRKQRRRRSHPGLSCTRRSYCSMDGSLLGKDRKIEALHLPPHSDCHIGHFLPMMTKMRCLRPFILPLAALMSCQSSSSPDAPSTAALPQTMILRHLTANVGWRVNLRHHSCLEYHHLLSWH